MNTLCQETTNTTHAETKHVENRESQLNKNALNKGITEEISYKSDIGKRLQSDKCDEDSEGNRDL